MTWIALGKFIVIDGGCEFEPDRDRLYRCLKENSVGQRPMIASWILTHLHSDHYYCFIAFIEQYVKEVLIEFLFNFPESNDFDHYPSFEKTHCISSKGVCFESRSEATLIPVMLEWMRMTNTKIYMPHTGKKYQIGDSDCEILANMDDTIYCTDNVNATSLMIRMVLSDQIILWTADASFSIAKLPERYGSYLRVDLLRYRITVSGLEVTMDKLRDLI